MNVDRSCDDMCGLRADMRGAFSDLQKHRAEHGELKRCAETNVQTDGLTHAGRSGLDRIRAASVYDACFGGGLSEHEAGRLA